MMIEFFLVNKMAKKETKTNAMRMLDEAEITYQVHVYDTEDGKLDAVTVAEKHHQVSGRKRDLHYRGPLLGLRAQ